MVEVGGRVAIATREHVIHGFSMDVMTIPHVADHLRAIQVTDDRKPKFQEGVSLGITVANVGEVREIKRGLTWRWHLQQPSWYTSSKLSTVMIRRAVVRLTQKIHEAQSGRAD